MTKKDSDNPATNDDELLGYLDNLDELESDLEADGGFDSDELEVEASDELPDFIQVPDEGVSSSSLEAEVPDDEISEVDDNDIVDLNDDDDFVEDSDEDEDVVKDVKPRADKEVRSSGFLKTGLSKAVVAAVLVAGVAGTGSYFYFGDQNALDSAAYAPEAESLPNGSALELPEFIDSSINIEEGLGSVAGVSQVITPAVENNLDSGDLPAENASGALVDIMPQPEVVEDFASNDEIITLLSESEVVQSEMLAAIESLKGELNEIKNEVTVKEASQQDLVKSNEMAVKKAIAQALLAQEEQRQAFQAEKRLTAGEKAKLTSGLDRLKGFKVVSTNTDGDMSIVETSSGRIIVLFESEKFHISGKTYRVTSVSDAGHLLVVDGKYFIDEIYVPRKQVASSSTAKAEQKTLKPNNNSTELKAESPSTKASSSGSVPKPEGSGYVIAEKNPNLAAPEKEVLAPVNAFPVSGWSLNSVTNDGYLVLSKDGKWLSLAKGDRIPGIGHVTGLTADGSLLVGEFVIAPANK